MRTVCRDFYNLTVENSVVTTASTAKAAAEGEITEMSTSTVTIGGKEYPYTAMYQIDNAEAGATAVTVASYPVGMTAKVYGDTVYLTFIAEPYTAPVSGTPGERTLKNYLQTAMNPVGTALYVYGGSWDWQDVNSSNQALTIGLPQSWIDFFQQQDANYTYMNDDDPAHSYYPHNSWNQYYYAGVDCSAYIGWTVYNVMHTESTTNDLSDGYVMSAVKMAKTFADKGWGTWTRDIKSFKPGDIFSMSGHVWTVLGVCDDGSIVFLHSTPSDSKAGQGGGGVQLSALNPNSDNDKNCEAYKLVTKYMTKYYPEWSTRYDAVLRSYDSYATPASGSEYSKTWSGNFSWNLDGTGLTDPDGYADMSAAEILADLFGDAETQPNQKGFNDVKSGDYFYDAVNWAVEKGITTGTSATTFSPNASCTRAQIVTFLWRASGSPEPKTASNPFTDVAANAYYCKAVLWAVENGITTGTSATTFSPDAPCTRAQGVTFLWRANGSKAASAAASFTDVASDAYYAPAVAWAAEQNVTGGVGNGLFSPDTTCTRAQNVSMLYRLR